MRLRPLALKVTLSLITFSLSLTIYLSGFLSPAWAIPSLASLHTYHEQPGQTTLRSKQSLRDRNERAWQTILFKRSGNPENPQGEDIYLRLIGFPGMAEINRQQPIQITTGSGLTWTAQPQLDVQTTALPANAAQYNVQAFAADLKADIPLEISLMLSNRHSAQLVIPPFVVHEWRTLINQSLVGL